MADKAAGGNNRRALRKRLSERRGGVAAIEQLST